MSIPSTLQQVLVALRAADDAMLAEGLTSAHLATGYAAHMAYGACKCSHPDKALETYIEALRDYYARITLALQMDAD